ncbi:alpha-ketoglutarate-dependent dioxygenase AlkB family protein [Alteromonas oceanisediminis]|uniref:alpha-ketoglutarate-dependent dioxygenase AlkB family protein n=1 Tax=Alteromonas oceanisediminis TaxID=2836180 RepID=UPI001BD97D66|nr:alpha-ketoglutarate-dependent dioxygenase AlkB [Alteromonas oceanisediminis]MBT0585338.1 alpha-ketoglutarate-dependent dioxygenase AlkB [Alteromonas oceanisediminis]
MQQSVFFDNQGCHTLNMADADVIFLPNWLTKAAADNAFTELQDTLQWRQDTIKLYGKEHLIPRLQAWYGDSHAQYAYSGVALAPLPWTSCVSELKAQCEAAAQHRFNSVLANWYRDGRDSMGMHSDDEPQLGKQPVIASVSLGAERKLLFKHKQTNVKCSIVLTHGSLLIMAGKTQQCWKHGINKSKRIDTGRINLTFRHIQSALESPL